MQVVDTKTAAMLLMCSAASANSYRAVSEAVSIFFALQQKGVTFFELFRSIRTRFIRTSDTTSDGKYISQIDWLCLSANTSRQPRRPPSRSPQLPSVFTDPNATPLPQESWTAAPRGLSSAGSISIERKGSNHAGLPENGSRGINYHLVATSFRKTRSLDLRHRAARFGNGFTLPKKKWDLDTPFGVDFSRIRTGALP